MCCKRLFLLTFFLPGLLAAGGSLETDITPGMMLAHSCAACHGTQGKSPGAIPSINGKSAKFIYESLKAFKTDARPSTVMGRHAKGYSDEELRRIAEFFSEQ